MREISIQRFFQKINVLYFYFLKLFIFRRVTTLEGQRLALVYPRCSFYECSAARDPENVEQAFREFIREVQFHLTLLLHRLLFITLLH